MVVYLNRNTTEHDPVEPWTQAKSIITVSSFPHLDRRTTKVLEQAGIKSIHGKTTKLCYCIMKWKRIFWDHISTSPPLPLFTGASGKQSEFITAEEADIGRLTGTSITLTRAAPILTIRQAGEPSVFKGYYCRRAADQTEIQPGRRELMKQKRAENIPTGLAETVESNWLRLCEIDKMASPWLHSGRVLVFIYRWHLKPLKEI